MPNAASEKAHERFDGGGIRHRRPASIDCAALADLRRQIAGHAHPLLGDHKLDRLADLSCHGQQCRLRADRACLPPEPRRRGSERLEMANPAPGTWHPISSVRPDAMVFRGRLLQRISADQYWRRRLSPLEDLSKSKGKSARAWRHPAGTHFRYSNTGLYGLSCRRHRLAQIWQSAGWVSCRNRDNRRCRRIGDVDRDLADRFVGTPCPASES